MITLNSDRLRLEIAEPTECAALTTRFDRAGFIAEIVLDGRHRFGATEPYNLSHPSSGGRGLCNEYLFDVSDQVSPGEYFPKFGVGLLKKATDARYNSTLRYSAIECEVETEVLSPNQARFITKPMPCIGYALHQTKLITVDGNRVCMRVTAQNAGERALDAREYCHNFLTINGMAVGPAYKLRVPDMADMGEAVLGGTLRGDGRGFTFTRYATEASFFRADSALITGKGPFEWSLINADGAASIHGRDDIDIDMFQVWSADHMVSIENFHKLVLQPGETDTWERTWTFEALA
jgi:hypothetical protein